MQFTCIVHLCCCTLDCIIRSSVCSSICSMCHLLEKQNKYYRNYNEGEVLMYYFGVLCVWKIPKFKDYCRAATDKYKHYMDEAQHH